MAYNNLRINGTDYPLGGGGAASWNNLADKPMETVQTVLFSDDAKSFTYVSSYSSYIYETNDAQLLQKWYTAWENAIVTIDGVQYLPEKQTAYGENYLGDGLRMQTGEPVTGEPYAIGVTNGYLVIALFADSAPEDTSAAVVHTVSVTLENEVFQSDYLPAVPEFDLTAMGLPAAGTLSRGVLCDTTALRAALEKGPVKLNLQAYTSQTATADITFIGSAANLGGTYQLSYIGAFGSDPIMLIVVVTSTAISSWMIKLAVPASTGTTT